jgi:tetratricopeptide (TPR) repeat protein
MDKASERSKSLYQYHIGVLYTFQDRYNEAESYLFQRVLALEKYSYPSNWVYIRVAKNYAKLGNKFECRRFIDLAKKSYQKASIPRTKAICLCEQGETFRILKEYEYAKAACKKSLTWFLTNAEDPEDYQIVAEARLVMGKILVDMQNYQEAIEYLDKAKTAFAIGKHYALGESMLYLGKAYSGIGGQPQAKTLITEALAEFQRLELSNKEKEARGILKKLMA